MINIKTVIMAGGKGTRVAEFNSRLPKPLIPMLGKPVLEYQIDCLRRQGCTNITITVGHLGNAIKDYFGDGRHFDVDISYIEETTPLGTAGALFYLKETIKDDFLLINGDIIFDMDVGRFADCHKCQGGLATVLVHPNDHPYDSGIIISDSNNLVTDWLHKENRRRWYRNRVNAGLHMISPELLDRFTGPKKIDLDRDILRPIIPERMLYAYSSSEYVKDMGTPDRFHQVEKDIKDGKLEKKKLGNQQKAVFLDRDGTINKYVGFLRNIQDFQLNDGVAEFIRSINRSSYLAIVVTNQPVIARGEVSWEDLNEIHNKMETLLGEKGAYIDDIFVCPHHPEGGFRGERREYKTECPCRKPKPGLLFSAANKFNIDLTQSYMVGDSVSDMEAGRTAGCQSVMFHGDKQSFINITKWFESNVF